ncbi:tetratricopeptide repeat protein [Aquimarina sp. 2201CG1-2-11]|uniref:CHAT domain-containing protein n=1 Tax=Aquimarina discodermiae TaxID=3231043 RepID=UPI00346221F0
MNTHIPHTSKNQSHMTEQKHLGHPTSDFWPITTILWCIFLLTITPTHSQTQNDTLVAYRHFKKADSLLTYRVLDSAIAYFKTALPIYEHHKNWERVAGCYNKIAESKRLNTNYEESLNTAKTALEICKKYLPKNNKEEANAYDNFGDYHCWGMRDFDTALSYYKRALSIRKKIFSTDHLSFAKSYLLIGNIYLLKGQYINYDIAENYYLKSLEIKEKKLGLQHFKTRYNYSNLAIVYYRKQKYNRALEHIKINLKIQEKVFKKNHFEHTKSYEILGNIYEKTSDYNKAINYLKKNLDILTKAHKKNKVKITFLLTQIGICYKKKGEYEKALEFYYQALEINEDLKRSMLYNNIGIIYKYKGEYNKSLQYLKKALYVNNSINGEINKRSALNYNNIGVIYKLKEDYKQAVFYLKKALGLRLQLLDQYHIDISYSYNDLGEVYAAQRSFSKALEYFQKGLHIRMTIFGKNHPDIADSYDNLGDIYFDKKEYTTALTSFQKALSIRLAVFNTHHPKVAQSYNTIAKVYWAQKEYTISLSFYDKAIDANKNLQKQDGTDHYYDLNILLNSLQGKAKVYNLLYQQDQNQEHLANAIAIYQQADVLIDQIRGTYTAYQDKVAFSQKAKAIYHEAMATQLLLYELQKDQKALAHAFYYTEKSKANTLKELLNNANAKKYTGLPSDLVTLEKELRTDQAFYQSQITKAHAQQKRDTAKITRFENQLFEITQRQDSVIRILEKNYPAYYQLAHQKKMISLQEIQQQLDEHTTILEFFTADTLTYAFIISKKQVSVQELVTPDLVKRVEAFRNHITSKDLQAYKTLGHDLYQQLVDPIRHQLVGDQLVIIPDGPLWHLNFEILLTQNDASNNPVNLSYLLRNYAISYANAANLVFTQDRQATTASNTKKQECLAFSFSDSIQLAKNNAQTHQMSLSTLRGLGDDLPGTRKEIKAISNIIDGQYYYGAQAIEANFKKNANRYNILHLALHGDVDHERPENSKLYFTKTKDTLEDNLLYGHELFAMDIPAELTVLSACNTGTGKIAKGEGVMSLGNAFQYAGTKSLLLSRWEVSDNTTPELMTYFYTHLKKGMNKAKALQQAKLQYLANADIHRTQPVYWAGFYLVGDPAPIHFESNTLLYWALGIGGMLVFMLIGWWYRRKRHS